MRKKNSIHLSGFDLYQRKTPTDSGTWLNVNKGVRLGWHEESDRDLDSGFVLNMSTWLEDVQTALKNLGGEAHLSKIFEEVKRVRKNLNPSWTRTVQKELERHSSDSSVWNSKYKGKEDLFYSACWREGNGNGRLTPVSLNSAFLSNLVHNWIRGEWSLSYEAPRSISSIWIVKSLA